MITIGACNENHRYESIVKQKLFFFSYDVITSYGVFDVHTRVHKFHFSSDARERNGVFWIINSSIYQRLDTASQKNCKRENVYFCRT